MGVRGGRGVGVLSLVTLVLQGCVKITEKLFVELGIRLYLTYCWDTESEKRAKIFLISGKFM